jgi:hypothetical protein
MAHKATIALWACCLPGIALAGDYVGTLKPAGTALAPSGFFSFSSEAPLSTAVADSAYRFKLGYKYSRYLAIESEVVDFGKMRDPFANPANLASAFRSTGFGVDTIAMLPIWRFSFYGRMGAYRGDARGGFGFQSLPVADPSFTRGSRWRYGLGLRYDFTKSLGVRAELERHSPFGSTLLTDVDSGEQVSVGVSWRF